jgi:predicted DNA-binding transcriptional regulator YafY
MAQVWQDPALARASQIAIGKILSVLPAAAWVAAQSMAIYAPPIGMDPVAKNTLQTLREAAQTLHKVEVQYKDAADQITQRILRPLGCFYWGKVWTLAAWCEVRNEFRTFRLDRVTGIQLVEGEAGQFKEEEGKRLSDYLRSVAPPNIQEKLDGTA